MSDFAQYAGFLVNYMFGRKHVPKCVSKVLEKIERKKTKLISTRANVEQTLNTIDHDTDEVSNDMVVWLEETNSLLHEMENLRTQRKVPSWSEFKKLQKRIKAHNKKCHFDPISTPIQTSARFSSKRKDFICFKSREKASDELLKALQDHNCYKIGLFGRQGSGKTWLMKATAKTLKKYFYKVLFVTVTHNIATTIQNEIANLLNLRFNNCSQDEKANIISSTISYLSNLHCRPILVIFDDVREKLDLQRIGIPCDSDRCKVVMTTRCQEKCDFIDCQKEIQLDPLSIWETRTLFEKHSRIHGIHDEKNSTSSELLNIAREIVSQCDGLPGKIIKVGSSLICKPIEEWKISLDRLRHPMGKCKIFLSFRGDDTRYNFTGTLWNALDREGFSVFMDDRGLESGDEISSSLINAIEASWISIVVLSENFADSHWCLDELVTILNCKKKKNQMVWPIFYDVEASDVRNQKNSYEKAMAKQKERFKNDPDKVKKWRSALSEVAGLKGYAYKPRQEYEYKLIREIVERVNNNCLNMESIDMD